MTNSKRLNSALHDTGFDGVFSRETPLRNCANVDDLEKSARKLYSIAKAINSVDTKRD